MKKLAIITSHPIQYNAPLFRLLTERGRIRIKVFYTWGQTQEGPVYDPDFGKAFRWDIPLLEGYEYRFIENLSKKPGAGHFGGIVNKQLIPAVEAWQPHAVLVYGWSFKSHLQALRHFKGKIPVLFRGDSTLLDEPEGFSIKKAARRLFLRWVYHHVDLCLYTGSANKAYYLRHGIREEQLRFAPHAVDNERFAAADAERNAAAKAWRSELGIDAAERVFLFAGKMEPKKDPLTLLQAFRECNAPHTRLVFAGNGVLEQQLKKEAAGDERIIFLPFQNQQRMPVLYRLADVYVLPSRGPGETWGLAVNEAMACRRPVVVSDKCGCAADLVQDAWGRRFRAGSKEDLGRQLVFAVQHAHLLPAMGQQAQMHIQNWSLATLAAAIEQAV